MAGRRDGEALRRGVHLVLGVPMASALSDDYVMDGRVITEMMRGNGQLKQTADLGACYKQLTASVGTIGTDTLLASTAALASTDDGFYTRTDTALSALATGRDALASQVKQDLDNIEFHGARPDSRRMAAQLAACRGLIVGAAALAQITSHRSTGSAALPAKQD